MCFGQPASRVADPYPPRANVLLPAMVPEAPLEQTDAGLAPAGAGWFVLNAREARWRQRPVGTRVFP